MSRARGHELHKLRWSKVPRLGDEAGHLTGQVVTCCDRPPAGSEDMEIVSRDSQWSMVDGRIYGIASPKVRDTRRQDKGQSQTESRLVVECESVTAVFTVLYYHQ